MKPGYFLGDGVGAFIAEHCRPAEYAEQVPNKSPEDMLREVLQMTRARMAERDERQEPASRFDAGKPRYELIPPDALEELAKVYTAGAAKYGDHNWTKGMSWSRCFGSMMRHAWKFWSGEEIDADTGCHHMAMVAWNAFALFVYHARGLGTDDRMG